MCIFGEDYNLKGFLQLALNIYKGFSFIRKICHLFEFFQANCIFNLETVVPSGNLSCDSGVML